MAFPDSTINRDVTTIDEMTDIIAFAASGPMEFPELVDRCDCERYASEVRLNQTGSPSEFLFSFRY